MAESLLEYLYSLEPSEFFYRGAITCHYAIATYEDIESDAFDDIIEADRFSLVRLGYAPVLPVLYFRARRMVNELTDPDERADAERALAFWGTVRYLMTEHYQRTLGGRWNARLAAYVFCGIGCEPDVERAISLDTKALLIERSSMPDAAVPAIREACVRETEPHPEVAELLRAFISGDAAAIRQGVDRIERNLGRTVFTIAWSHVINSIGAARSAQGV